MECLVTWIEGEEVFYRFADERDLEKMWEPEKEFIVVPLQQ